ncbi:unnamed protein product, partial [Mesorhabditis spiculigera]
MPRSCSQFETFCCCVIVGLLVYYFTRQDGYEEERSKLPPKYAPDFAVGNVDFPQDPEITRKFYETSVEARRKLLSNVLQNKSSTKEWAFAGLYNGLVPEVLCPSLIRIGAVNDGGKWMCRPWGMPDNCSIYSLGVNQDTSFEREVQALTGSRCRIFAYDKNAPKSNSVLKGFEEIRAKFKRGFIGDVQDEAAGKLSLIEEMRLNGDQEIEILKIDIEGGEFVVLPSILQHTKICQILVEVHGDPNRVLKLLKLLGQHEYRLFSYEINGKHHTLAEYSLVHKDCFEKYGITPYAHYLDGLDG